MGDRASGRYGVAVCQDTPPREVTNTTRTRDRRGDIPSGGKDSWIGIRDAVIAGWDSGFADEKRRRMNALTQEAAAARR